MTLQIELSQDKEDALRFDATRRGVSLEERAKTLLEESLPAHANGDRLADDEEELLLDQLAALGKGIPPSPPGETYSRRTIYADHD